MHISLSPKTQLTKFHSPPSTHGTTLMFSGAASHKLEKWENVPLRWLTEQKPWRHRGGKGKPSSCAALLLMCSFATTKPGRLRKARVGVTSNLWTHRDDPSSFPSLRQSFAAGNLDPSPGTPQGGTSTSRQRAGRCGPDGSQEPHTELIACYWEHQDCTRHSWSAASTGASFRRLEVERGSMAECMMGI